MITGKTIKHENIHSGVRDISSLYNLLCIILFFGTKHKLQENIFYMLFKKQLYCKRNDIADGFAPQQSSFWTPAQSALVLHPRAPGKSGVQSIK